MKINIYPNPWDLRYFQEIAFTGNLSRAAERLNVGQPALSLALKRLEDCLDVKLFLRRSRGLQLTAAGQRLLRESNRLLSTWEGVLSETKKSETDLVGKYTLGCHQSVAIYALKDSLRNLYSMYPGIELQLVHGLSRIVCENVISGAVDFGIVVNPVRHPELVIHKLATDEVSFWKATKGLEDVLICNPQLVQTQTLLNKIKKKNPFTRTIASDNLEVIATLTGAGTGVGILPTRAVQTSAPDLKKLAGYPVFSDEITFVYRADLPKTASSRVIIETLKSLRF